MENMFILPSKPKTPGHSVAIYPKVSSIQCTKCDILLLIGEAEGDTERREDKPLEGLAGSQTVRVFLDRSHILSIEMNQVGAVSLDTRWSHGLGEHGGTASNMPAEQDGGRGDAALLGDGDNGLSGE